MRSPIAKHVEARTTVHGCQATILATPTNMRDTIRGKALCGSLSVGAPSWPGGPEELPLLALRPAPAPTPGWISSARLLPTLRRLSTHRAWGFGMDGARGL